MMFHLFMNFIIISVTIIVILIYLQIISFYFICYKWYELCFFIQRGVESRLDSLNGQLNSRSYPPHVTNQMLLDRQHMEQDLLRVSSRSLAIDADVQTNSLRSCVHEFNLKFFCCFAAPESGSSCTWLDVCFPLLRFSRTWPQNLTNWKA